MQFPGENVRWGFIDVFAIMALIFGVGITYQWWGPSLLAYLVYNQVISGTFISEFILGYLVQFVVTVGGVLFFALVVRRASLDQLGLKRVRWRSLLNWGVGGGLLLFFTVLVLGLLLERLLPQVPPQVFETVLRQVQTAEEFLILLFIVSVFAPFAEELYFRGFVYPVFRNRTGVLAGLLLSGLFFGAAHWDIWRLVPLALGGAGLALIYEKSNSLYSCWLAHGVWNGVMGLIFYFAFLHG